MSKKKLELSVEGKWILLLAAVAILVLIFCIIAVIAGDIEAPNWIFTFLVVAVPCIPVIAIMWQFLTQKDDRKK